METINLDKFVDLIVEFYGKRWNKKINPFNYCVVNDTLFMEELSGTIKESVSYWEKRLDVKLEMEHESNE